MMSGHVSVGFKYSEAFQRGEDAGRKQVQKDFKIDRAYTSG